MKALPILLMVFITSMAYSQDGPELAALNNFKVEDLKVKWQKVFERDTLGMSRGILEAKSLKLIERSVDGVFLDVVNLPLGKRGTNTCNGRAKIEFKEGKYRVTIWDISWNAGSDGQIMSSVLVGGSVDLTSFIDKDWIKKDHFRSELPDNVVRQMNRGFEQLFTFTQSVKNDDW